MSYDTSQHPLLEFRDHVRDWSAAAQRGHWRALAENRSSLEELRSEAKYIIVWLELKGQERAADLLDHAMEALRQAFWGFEGACENVYPPDDFRCLHASWALFRAAKPVAEAALDLDKEIPPEVWEGFGDE